MNVLELLLEQKNMKLKSGLYSDTLLGLTYHTNKIEGSTLTMEQTQDIYTFNKIEGFADVDDIIETKNLFQMFDYMLDNCKNKLSITEIKEYHRILKTGTEDSKKDWFKVGDYKRFQNSVGMLVTASPDEVEDKMDELLITYNAKKKIEFKDVIDFHYRFEIIHPFQDGNGRVGRNIMFRECLRNEIMPFIITEDMKFEYSKGLREYERNPQLLLEVCAKAQQEYKKKVEELDRKENSSLEEFRRLRSQNKINDLNLER